LSEYTIGIKTGDGEFYPILEESFKGKKRFVLTTVNDNQTSVQIDFYRSSDSHIDGAEYIGSLVIENIQPELKKVPEIEVIIGIDDNKSLHAVARNLSSEDDKQSLTVSLESLSSGLTYDIPEFEMDNKLQPTSLFEDDQDIDTSDQTRANYSEEKTEQKAKPNLLHIVLFVIAGLLIIAILTFGIFALINLFNKKTKPPIDIGDNQGVVRTEQVVATTTRTSEPTQKITETQVANVVQPTVQPVPVSETKKKFVKGLVYYRSRRYLMGSCRRCLWKPLVLYKNLYNE